MDHLETIRKQLDRLLEEATADQQRALDTREQELAAAMELLSIDSRVRTAYHQGEADALGRVQRLIQQQLDWLPRNSSARTVLRTLSQMVSEERS